MLTFQPEGGIIKEMEYDENGNLVRVNNGCGTNTYTWDVRNRLSGISGFTVNCSSFTANFKYDALGRRIEKTINGRTIKYLYDGMDIVQEIENGQVTVNYIRTLNIDEPLARIKSDGMVRYYQTDALGSVIALTDDSGVVKTMYAYDPFGNTTVSGEASDNPFQYTGRENDNTGLYYYRARYYSPELQRFISEDPILGPMNSSCSGPNGSPKLNWLVPTLLNDPKNFNSYLYVGNNPVNYTDPKGLTNCTGYLTCCTCGDAYACGAYGICVIGGGFNDCIRDCLLERYTCFQSVSENVVEHAICYAKCLASK